MADEKALEQIERHEERGHHLLRRVRMEIRTNFGRLRFSHDDVIRAEQEYRRWFALAGHELPQVLSGTVQRFKHTDETFMEADGPATDLLTAVASAQELKQRDERAGTDAESDRREHR